MNTSQACVPLTNGKLSSMYYVLIHGNGCTVYIVSSTTLECWVDQSWPLLLISLTHLVWSLTCKAASWVDIKGGFFKHSAFYLSSFDNWEWVHESNPFKWASKHVTIFSGSNCTKFIVLACRMGIGKRCWYLVVVVVVVVVIVVVYVSPCTKKQRWEL